MSTDLLSDVDTYARPALLWGEFDWHPAPGGFLTDPLGVDRHGNDAGKQLDAWLNITPHELHTTTDGVCIFIAEADAKALVAQRKNILSLQDLQHYCYIAEQAGTDGNVYAAGGDQFLLRDPYGFVEHELQALGIECSREAAILRSHAQFHASTGIHAEDDYGMDADILVTLPDGYDDAPLRARLDAYTATMETNNPYATRQPHRYSMATPQKPAGECTIDGEFSVQHANARPTGRLLPSPETDPTVGQLRERYLLLTDARWTRDGEQWVCSALTDERADAVAATIKRYLKLTPRRQVKDSGITLSLPYAEAEMLASVSLKDIQEIKGLAR